MFFLYHHHDVARLASLLAALRSRGDASPLAPDTVLVPNHGLGRWLKMTLAEREGVAANLETVLPARYMWELIADSFPEGRADSAAFERANLRWHLYALLPEIAAEVPAVDRYLRGERELRRLQLADQLADVFDQYLIYRRDMLAAWEAGAGEDRPPADWQAPVWRALVARLGARHRARLLGELLERVETGAPIERGHWPQRLYCFGVADLPPDYLRLLYAVGREREVHLLFHNPSEAYWGDIQHQPVSLAVDTETGPAPGEPAIEAGHPLLASLGYGGRDFLRLLYADELAEILEPELGDAMAYEPPAADTLLHRIQAGVIRMDAGADETEMARDDASLQIHACHGPLREVQVLHDQLLDLLSRDATLEPRDVVVMVADVAAYAPAIHAVFGGAEDPLHIPYNVSDRPRSASHPLALTFRQLLELPLARWTASEVMALAAVPAVMRRFGLDEAALDELRGWIGAAGVRWGLDAETREAAGAGRWEQNTWRFGLDRLLLGAVQSDPNTLADGVAPWTELEGGGTEAVGRLWWLLEQLRHWRDALAEPATGQRWQQRLLEMTDALFRVDPDDRDEQAALQAVREAIAELGRAGACIGDAPIAWEAVREVLDDALEEPAERQPFLAGGVTFCGLVPLRAVPFRVVCLLGMDDDVFPRQERNRAFNLIRRFPRLGDRSRRADDRLLFLQALLAAGNVFYVSYTGQDVRSGERMEPATVLAELLDFVDACHLPAAVDARERLVTEQPMQPFSPRYFERTPSEGAESRVFTFRGAWRTGTLALADERTEAPVFVDDGSAPEPAMEELELDALARFWSHPPRHFFRDVLRLDLEAASATLDDEEPRGLDSLTAHWLRRELFERALEGAAIGDTPDVWMRAQGVLPPPPLDLGPYSKLAAEVEALLGLWRRWHGEAERGETLEVDVTLPCGVRLTGWLEDVRPDGLRRIHVGRLRVVRQLADWIELLALRASGHDGELRCAGLTRQGAVEVLGASVTADAAREHLDALVRGYLEGQRRPLCFLPDLGGKFVDRVARGKPSADGRSFEQRALDDCNGYLAHDHQDAWEMRDAYFPYVAPPPSYLGDDPASSEFCRWAERVCGPLIEHLAVADEDEA